MDTYVHDSGAWRKVKQAWVKVAGVWTLAQDIYVHSGGGWNLVYQYAFPVNLTFNSPEANVNLRSKALAAGWDGVSPLLMNVTVPSGSYLYSNDVSLPALDTGTSFPTNSAINLSIASGGAIIGKGGFGGNAATPSAAATSGQSGGPALKVQTPITLNNLGLIGGGGGGGGGGGFDVGETTYTGMGGSTTINPTPGGGAGGGAGFGAPGSGYAVSGTIYGANGTNGTSSAAGLGGASVGGNYSPRNYGGNGGDFGQAGTAGDFYNSGQSGDFPNGGAGLGGSAIIGNSNVSYIAAGTIKGAVV